MTHELGTRWETGKVYYKFYSSCRWTHTAIDIILSLRQKHTINVDQINEILIRTYPEAATLSEVKPRDETTARFSIPYTVAVALLEGKVGPEQFCEDKIRSTKILKVAKKVVLKPDSALDHQLAKRPAEVTITLRDGRQYAEFEEDCFGDCALQGTKYYPPDKSIEEKFKDLASRVHSRERVEEIKACIKTIEEAKSVGVLADLLSPT
jgi:2-methylcitrate dehydratase PrpD